MTARSQKLSSHPGNLPPGLSVKGLLQVYLPITYHPRGNPSYRSLNVGRVIKCTTFNTVTAYPASVYRRPTPLKRDTVRKRRPRPFRRGLKSVPFHLPQNMTSIPIQSTAI